MYKSVAECYKGQSVFITGGTGFLGKALVEKLLYSCPGLDKIYLLVRENQKDSAQRRVQKLLEQPLFTRLRHKRFEDLKKVIPIAGDIAKPNLGIKDEDEKLLTDNVSMVFHVAATIKFNEPLEVAMNLNVGGTERILNLSQRMNNIKCFVHISTAYSYLDRPVIEEITYTPPLPVNEVKKLVSNGITEKEVKKLLKKFKRPNTYTFTKALAENLVAENSKNIPSIIIRPALVSGSLAEPMPGWVDNWFGPTDIMNMIGKGWNRVLLARPTYALDLIPVDYVSNLMVVAATKCDSSRGLTVLNSASSGENPIETGNFVKLVIADNLKNKTNDIPMPFLIYTDSKMVVSVLTILLQKIPAFIADMFLAATSKKTRFTKMVNRVVAMRDSVEHFTSNNWTIRAPNARAVAQSLSPSDKQEFPCDPKDIKWEDYVPIYCQGVRQILMNK